MARDDMAQVGTRIYDRIRNTARAERRDVQFAFQKFALERLLARIEASPWAGRYAVKGGMLMLALPGGMSRPTEDMDLSSTSEVTLEGLKEALREVAAAVPEQEDGLVFSLDEAKTRVMLVESPHPTVRAMLDAELRTRYAPVRMRIMLDVSQGEGIYPGLSRIRLPVTCKGFEPPELPCYPWETVVAEKLHAILQHGAGNTRMKDFYDLVAISRNMNLQEEAMAEAVVIAFAASGRPILTDPHGLTEGFAMAKEGEWNAFAAKRKLPHAPSTMVEAVSLVRDFALPVLELAAEKAEARATAPAPF